MKTCLGNSARDLKHIESYSDREILEGLSHHSDPKWWKRRDIKTANQAYLRRWGAYLRREARRRGLPLKPES